MPGQSHVRFLDVCLKGKEQGKGRLTTFLGLDGKLSPWWCSRGHCGS